MLRGDDDSIQRRIGYQAEDHRFSPYLYTLRLKSSILKHARLTRCMG